jgi:hypothetical protein
MAQWSDERNVGHCHIGLPAADGLRGNRQNFRKTLLRQILLAAKILDGFSKAHGDNPPITCLSTGCEYIIHQSFAVVYISLIEKNSILNCFLKRYVQFSGN